ncbi:hypothetical protein ERO13_D05G002150v2 [Gossypium hirsutum]|uniref:Uncharacterized protein n=3 Tax=Gossypium TaxID=3633 RepID=A0A5J5R663_GOSBA|nr:hypothetical protein ES319_D05G002400v1 [Gossypium barbadense]KAG4143915.1 hypothetical protein ERO13_D05G002150v2 [Gossypium hirsutum]TYG66460.1 hypothetical protein ES288_D05G002500v1 [Gossypium darwinii]TYH68666.1 hypothetical protein ES332_D05G002500v1 [Gossypium tomentosum]
MYLEFPFPHVAPTWSLQARCSPTSLVASFSIFLRRLHHGPCYSTILIAPNLAIGGYSRLSIV